MTTETATQIGIDRSLGDFSYPESHKFDAGYGLTPATIDYIAGVKGEADWIREFRHRALDTFNSKPMPTHWASKDLENIVFQNIRYYLANGQRATRSWEDVPDDVKRTCSGPSTRAPRLIPFRLKRDHGGYRRWHQSPTDRPSVEIARHRRLSRSRSWLASSGPELSAG